MYGITLYRLYGRMLHYAEKLGIAFLIYAISGVNAFAMSSNRDLGEREFAGLKPIADETLGMMRGGFVFSNGIKLDFALKVQSAIDGAIVHELNLVGDKFNDIKPGDLRTVIQVGDNNYADIPHATKIKEGGGGNYNNHDYGKNDEEKPYTKHHEENNYKGGGGNYNNGPANPTYAAASVPTASVPTGITTASLQSTIQGMNAKDLPGILTVIQNSLDNKVIQHLNVLDVNVSNLGHYKLQALTAQINDPGLGLH